MSNQNKKVQFAKKKVPCKKHLTDEEKRICNAKKKKIPKKIPKPIVAKKEEKIEEPPPPPAKIKPPKPKKKVCIKRIVLTAGQKRACQLEYSKELRRRIELINKKYMVPERPDFINQLYIDFYKDLANQINDIRMRKEKEKLEELQKNMLYDLCHSKATEEMIKKAEEDFETAIVLNKLHQVHKMRKLEEKKAKDEIDENQQPDTKNLTSTKKFKPNNAKKKYIINHKDIMKMLIDDDITSLALNNPYMELLEMYTNRFNQRGLERVLKIEKKNI